MVTAIIVYAIIGLVWMLANEWGMCRFGLDSHLKNKIWIIIYILEGIFWPINVIYQFYTAFHASSELWDYAWKQWNENDPKNKKD